MNIIPDYLYHYTSIENLALILKNKTFRFRRLDILDDPEEGKTSDFKTFGRFIFVSCWTGLKEESLPLWSMYAGPNMKGVRIKLPSHIFSKKSFRMKQSSVENGNYTSQNGAGYYSYIDINDMNLQQYTVVPMQENLLQKVVYTKEQHLLYPNVFTETNINSQSSKKLTKTVNFKDVGKYKQAYWSFQDEYRYIFTAAPWNKDEALNCSVEDHTRLFDRLANDYLKINYHDEAVDANKFEDMIITLSPRVTAGERVIVELLIKEYNSNAKIEESSVRIR